MTPTEEFVLNAGATLVTLPVGGEFVALARTGLAARTAAVSNEAALWAITAEVGARHAVAAIANAATRSYVAYQVYVSGPVAGATAAAVGNSVLIAYDAGRGYAAGRKLEVAPVFRTRV
jgi:hypothetical protein